MTARIAFPATNLLITAMLTIYDPCPFIVWSSYTFSSRSRSDCSSEARFGNTILRKVGMARPSSVKTSGAGQEICSEGALKQSSQKTIRITRGLKTQNFACRHTAYRPPIRSARSATAFALAGGLLGACPCW